MTKEEINAIRERLKEYKKVGEWAPLVRDAHKDIEALLNFIETLYMFEIQKSEKSIESNPEKHV